jgi:hypothetical protein
MEQPDQALRRAEAGSICAYCGRERLTGRQKPEHPIPAVLDSEIVVFTACDECNSRAGREVDQPFLKDTLILLERARWPSAHPRARGRTVGHPFLNGGAVDADGTHLVIRDGEARYGAAVVRRSEGQITIKSDGPKETARALARLERQLAADGYAIESKVHESISSKPVQVQVSRRFSPAIGVRMGAKMALALASDTYDEGWRLSAEAEQLRTWMWDPEPKDPASGEPLGYEAIGADYPYADPPNHLAHFFQFSGGEPLHLVVVVFGRLPFPVPVAPAGSPLPSRAWRSGPTHGRDVDITQGDLDRAAIARFRAEHPLQDGS